MTVLPSPETMIVICTVILIAYTAHVLGKAFASSEQFEAMLKARERIMGLQADNEKLRELVRHMNTCIEHYESDGSVGCEHCPLDNDTGNCDYEQRMRELGVEVTS